MASVKPHLRTIGVVLLILGLCVALVCSIRHRPKPLPPVVIPVTQYLPGRESLVTKTIYVADPALTRERDRWRAEAESKQGLIDLLTFKVESLKGASGILPPSDTAAVAASWKLLRAEYSYASNRLSYMAVYGNTITKAGTVHGAPHFSIYGTPTGPKVKRGWPLLLGLGAAASAQAWPGSLSWRDASLFAAFRWQQRLELDAGIRADANGLKSFAEGRCNLWF